MRHSTSLHPLKMCGKLEENEGQACTGGKLTCPKIKFIYVSEVITNV